MPALPFDDARPLVVKEVLARRVLPEIETVALDACTGRVLAADAMADRDYPPFDRAMRDGFALRFEDTQNEGSQNEDTQSKGNAIRVIGEVRAGQTFDGVVSRGEAVEIMTGAPVPAGANAVLMIEHTTRQAEHSVAPNQSVVCRANISIAGCEARMGDRAVEKGVRITPAVLAWLATIGTTRVSVYRQPRVAILATGDELVDIDRIPLPHQIRNSNTHAVSAQVLRAGGIPIRLPSARDTVEGTRELVERGLEADLLLISGGVSAGRYDVVETVLAELGATFFFDRVLIQPGAPLVFGLVRGKFFFGLPGNPGSTMATFELFARAGIDLLSGMTESRLPIALARLKQRVQHKGSLTRFFPSVLQGGEVTPVVSQGSGDIPALARANSYVIARPERLSYDTGEMIEVLTTV